jgi:hypothetical protein
MDWEKIKELARMRNEKYKRDEEFYNVIGALVQVGLLRTNYQTHFSRKLTIEKLLRAGEIEPRVYEVLPAFLLRHADLIESIANLPEDLRAIKNGERPQTFRGMKYQHWI